MMNTTTPAQAWAILARHARDEITPLRLQELCRDNDRVSSLVAVYNTTTTLSGKQEENRSWIVDMSRQRMTDTTLNHLLHLATSVKLKPFITQMAWGQNNPRNPVRPKRVRPNSRQSQQSQPVAAAAATTTTTTTITSGSDPRCRHTNKSSDNVTHRRVNIAPIDTTGLSNHNSSNHNHRSQNQSYNNNNNNYEPCPSMHMAMRVPMGKGYEMFTADGTNVLTDIHGEWHRIHRLADSIRKGQLRGSSNAMLRDVVVIGKGVPIKALQFLYPALCLDQKGIEGSQWNMPIMSMAGGMAESAANRIRLNLTGVASMSSTAGTGSTRRRMRFVTTVDPIASLQAVSDLDPASTIVISIALAGTEETSAATKALKSWLLQALVGSSITITGNGKNADHILSKHMILVTGNDRIATVTNKPESVHLIPEHSRCEAFNNFSSATLLPLSIVFGWPLVEDFLNGAHDMDCHFAERNPRHNLPVLLALVDIWNTTFLQQQQSSSRRNSSSFSIRTVIPFTESLAAFPAFVGALEAQTTSGGSSSDNDPSTPFSPFSLAAAMSSSTSSVSSLVIDGGLDGAYDRAFFQGGLGKHTINSELIMPMDTQVACQTAASRSGYKYASGNNEQRRSMEDHMQATQDALMCSLFAHADELAFGNQQHKSSRMRRYPPMSTMSSSGSVSLASTSGDAYGNHNNTSGSIYSAATSEGNRPSLLLLTGKLDAFACGQLIALSEHRAAVKAHIWGVDPFAARQRVGSAVRMERTDQLQVELQKLMTDEQIPRTVDDEENEEEDEQGMILSTKTLLGHYANLIKQERMYNVPRNGSN